MACSLCDKPHYSRGWCEMHYTRWRRYGDPNVVLRYGPPPKLDPTYSGVHQRLRKGRGSAANHPCVDCGQPAHHWSYKKGGGGKPFSTDLDDYEPRCGSCHQKFDRPQRLCSVVESGVSCTAAHFGRGMCSKHYNRKYRKTRVANRNASTLRERE